MPDRANPFRLMHRSFDRVVYDRVKSDNVFALRGFDLGCVGTLFPGYVLERPASLRPGEPNFQVLGEVGGVVFLVTCTRFGRTCQIITGWVAAPQEAGLWFHPEAPDAPTVLAPNGLRGRFDPQRLGAHHPGDAEARPELTQSDLAATRSELATLRRRMMPPVAAAM